MSIPTLDDYPISLFADRIAGEERRRTISGVDIDDAASFTPPLVSIITVVSNNVQFVSRAIKSVLAQSYQNIEYIIIDGGSTDGTVDVIRDFSKSLSFWHSRHDNGIADAFNIGLAASRGAFIGIVNADDWIEPGHVQCAIDNLERSGAPFVYGDLMYHWPDGMPAYLMRAGSDYERSVPYRKARLHHPTVVARRSLFDTVGLFDLRLKIAMDREWFMRLEKHGFRGVHCPEIVGHMGLEGASDKDWRQGVAEIRRATISHGGSPARAWVSFLATVTKMSARRAIEQGLSESAMLRLRALMNPRLEKIDD